MSPTRQLALITKSLHERPSKWMQTCCTAASFHVVNAAVLFFGFFALERQEKPLGVSVSPELKKTLELILLPLN